MPRKSASVLVSIVFVFSTSSVSYAADTGQLIVELPTHGEDTVDGLRLETGSPDFTRNFGAVDSDGDGLRDFADNCSDVPNASQADADSDGFGTVCDADFDNDGFVGFADVSLFVNAFGSTDPEFDLDGDGFVGFGDLGRLKELFGAVPGPSGMSCAGSVPCPGAFQLAWPMPGQDAKDWVINNYVDLDPGAGVLDFLGGNKTYNGHSGVDIDVPNFRAMDNGFPILASAQGVVLDHIDSNFDRNMEIIPGCQWNFVMLGHPNGWRTIYGHLRKNSVVVAKGQVVNAGDTLGVVGSSGCSNAPHLHIEVLDQNNEVVEPFQVGLWSNPPVYNTPIGFMDAALYNGPISFAAPLAMFKDPPANATVVQPGSFLGIGLSMAGGASGDRVGVQLREAQAPQLLVWSAEITFTQVFRHSFWGWNAPISPDASGPHVLHVLVNDQIVKTYDVFLGPVLTGFQQVRHGVPAASYQGLFNDLVANGYRPVWVDGYDVNGATFFNVIFNQSNVASWTAGHGLDNAQFQTYFNQQVAANRRMVHVDSYLQGAQMRHTAIFIEALGFSWAAYHGVTVAQHNTLFTDLIAEGFRPLVISSVQEAGVQRITALYDASPAGAWLALANLTSASYQTEFVNNTAAGRTLAYLNGYTLNGTARFSAIWTSVNPTSWVARHDLTSAQFQAEFDTWTGAGLTTRIVTGYQNGAVANFGGYWTD